MEFKHESTIIKIASIITLNKLKKIQIWKLDDRNRPHRKQAKRQKL
jgi:ribosomal protein L21